MITADELRQKFDYSPDTGVFVRRAADKWHPHSVGQPAGVIDVDGYVVFKIGGRMYKAHRLAWLYMTGRWPDGIDHINRNRSDNRFGNLREATTKQNNENKNLQRNNSSGVRGVYFQKKAGKWRAFIYHNRRNIHLGMFDTAEEAAAARLAAQQALFSHASSPPAAT